MTVANCFLQHEAHFLISIIALQKSAVMTYDFRSGIAGHAFKCGIAIDDGIVGLEVIGKDNSGY
jgi:hypothetical protein